MQPTIEDNFEQYSASNVPSNIDMIERKSNKEISIEDSFNQYENLDKFLEVERRQAERKQVALKLIHDYKAMAIT